MRNLIGTLASVVLVVGLAASAWSSEADELRAKAKALQKQAEQLSQEGRRDEAEKLGREVKELLQAAQKHDQNSPKAGHREIDELHQQLKALAEKERALKESNNEEGLAEIRKHRAAIEHAIGEWREHQERKAGPKQAGKHPPELPEALADAGRRIKHIQIAVENLHAAGMHDVADELAKRAEGMQRELQQAHEQFAKEQSSQEKRKQAEPGHKHPEADRKHAKAAAPDDDLRHELQRLRAELNELREEIKKRP